MEVRIATRCPNLRAPQSRSTIHALLPVPVVYARGGPGVAECHNHVPHRAVVPRGPSESARSISGEYWAERVGERPVKRAFNSACLLTVRAAAEALTVSPATVYGPIAKGELPHVRLTRNGLRLRLTDIAAFLAA